MEQRSWCKACVLVDNRERERTPGRKRQKRQRDLAKTYGISETDYLERLATQGGVCAICGGHETKTYSRTGVVRKLSIDHDHETGIIRGILCDGCNNGIARFGDDPELLRKAATYLESMREVAAVGS